MKKYFVTSDVHGYYSILVNELNNFGFELNNKDHILVVCGDLFDRGGEAVRLFNLVKSLKDRFIYIKGNHEDLLEDCLYEIYKGNSISLHHLSNGTVDTIAQFVGVPQYDLMDNQVDIKIIKKKMKPVMKLIEQSLNYFEVGNHIMTHGWIPPNWGEELWRDTEKAQLHPFYWKNARWYNGMEMWDSGNRLPGKTIICGHWYADWGRVYIDNKSECINNPTYEPYKNEGIIALDSTVALSQKLNIITLEE